MKRGILFLIVMAVALAGMAQDWSKIIVGPDKPSKTELQRLKGITAPVQDQLNGKFSVADGVGFNSYIYNKTEVDNLNATDKANKFDRIFSELTGAQFIGPIANVSGVSPSLTLTDGTAIYDLYKIEKTTTVSKFAFILATQGNYTADNYNGIALLSYNPTTKVYTKIIESTDNGNIWKATALTLQEISFTPQVLQPGFYAVCTIWNASATTTAPVIKGFATIYQYNSVFIGHQLCGTRATQAAIPASESYSNLSSSNTPSGIYLR